MRLTPPLVERTLRQYEAQTLPDNHPAMPELNRLFGDHTFFLDDNGPNIVEPAESDKEGKHEAAKVVNLAIWSDDRKGLLAHEPEPTEVIVELGSEGPDNVH
jgi:hypothetical protein